MRPTVRPKIMVSADGTGIVSQAGGRRLRLRLAASWPWARQTVAAITRLQALTPG